MMVELVPPPVRLYFNSSQTPPRPSWWPTSLFNINYYHRFLQLEGISEDSYPTRPTARDPLSVDCASFTSTEHPYPRDGVSLL